MFPAVFAIFIHVFGDRACIKDYVFIDPPYNTGATDWKYNNNYVGKDDKYRHSKWLTFMEDRLRLAKKLLNPKDSVLIVTIDEKEYLRLGLLLEQLFPEARIQMVSTLTNSRGVARENGFARVDEYIYIVQFGDSSVSRLPLSDEWRVNIKEDKRVTHLRWSMLIRSGSHFLGLAGGFDLFCALESSAAQSSFGICQPSMSVCSR